MPLNAFFHRGSLLNIYISCYAEYDNFVSLKIFIEVLYDAPWTQRIKQVQKDFYILSPKI